MKSLAELQAIRDKSKLDAEVRKDKDGYRVVVGMATCGIAAGARPVMTALMDEVADKNLLNVTVAQTGCIGMCRFEPIVEIFDPKGEKTTYVLMDAPKMVKVVNSHLVQGVPINEYTIGAADK